MSNQKQVSAPGPGHTLVTVLANILLVLTSVMSGAVLGGVYVKLFVPRAAMGWDGITDALGGLMLGALVGLVASIILVGVLPVRRRFQVAAILFAAVLASMAWGVITHDSAGIDMPRE